MMLKHTHITRDIKPPGQCPGCDEGGSGKIIESILETLDTPEDKREDVTIALAYALRIAHLQELFFYPREMDQLKEVLRLAGSSVFWRHGKTKEYSQKAYLADLLLRIDRLAGDGDHRE